METKKSTIQKSHKNIDEYTPLSPIRRYKLSFSQITSAPRELWLIILIKFCVYGSLMFFNNLKIIYYSQVLQFTDTAISIIYGVDGIFKVVFLILLGSFPDLYGLKLSTFISSLSLIGTFASLILFDNRYIKIISILTLSNISESFSRTACKLGLKKYTRENYRTLAISFYTCSKYTVALLGGFCIQFLLSGGNQSYKHFIYCFVGIIGLGIFSAIASLFLRQLDFDLRDEEEIEISNKESSREYFRKILILKSFWRIFSVVVMVLIVKSVFFQQTNALPLYMKRNLGSDSNYGLTIVLNQFIVILLTPFFTYLKYYLTPYDVFIIGGLFACLSPLVFVIEGNYRTVIAFIGISSIAKSLYAPRLIEYLLETAPKSREAGVIAMVNIPGAITISFSGVMTGLLMNGYCTDDNTGNCELVWVWISIYAWPAVFILFFFRKWLEQPVFESEPYIQCSKEAQEN
jgi:MFS family permease